MTVLEQEILIYEDEERPRNKALGRVFSKDIKSGEVGLVPHPRKWREKL